MLQYFKAIGHKHKSGETGLYFDGMEGSFDEGISTSPTRLESNTLSQTSSPFGNVDPYTKRNSLFTEQECSAVDKFFRVSDAYLDGTDWQQNVPWLLPMKNMHNYINYCAVLGHDLSGFYDGPSPIVLRPYVKYVSGIDPSELDYTGSSIVYKSYFSGPSYGSPANAFKNVIGTENSIQTGLNNQDGVKFKAGGGFSIFEMNDGIRPHETENMGIPYAHEIGVEFTSEDGQTFNPSNLNINSIMLGSYYDMPVSPNMQLTFERQYEGVDTITTRGGSSLTNIRYLGPPPFAGYSQNFTKYQKGMAPNSNVSRSGRRKWRLKFDMLSDDNIMGAFESIGISPYPDYNYENSSEYYETDFTIPQDEGNNINDYYNPLLEENNLFSRLLVPTIGGRIPFLFNPRGGGSSPDNSPDQFAICTIDNKSLSFKQVNHRLYSVGLDIVETW